MADGEGHTLIVGIGNPDRSDDGVGCLVARRLAALGITGAQVMEHRAEASLLIPHLAAARRAFLIDASVSGAAPGAIRRFDVGAAPLPAATRKLSAHGLDLGEAIELARVLGQLPPLCVVYAIEAGHCGNNRALTPAVEQAAGRVAARLLAEIEHPPSAAIRQPSPPR